jgi:soluble lytic murein transglycosylase-like protein
MSLTVSSLRYCLYWVFILSSVATADVYKFVSRDGQVVYTDNPGHRGYKLVIKSQPRNDEPAYISLGSGRRFSESTTSYRGLPPGRSDVAGASNRELYEAFIDQAAYRHGLDPALLHAVIKAESAYNPGAVSNKGAMGLMQLMPGTAARYGVRDAYDPEQNILGGARYLRDLLGMFGSDVTLAVAAYNAGENNVIKYGNRVPPFNETRDYVSKVLGYYNRYN